MIKKLSMIALSVAVIGFCMAAVPQGADADSLTFKGSHQHAVEYGNATVSSPESIGFWTTWKKTYKVTLYRVCQYGIYDYTVRGACGASKSGRVRLPYINNTLSKNY